MHMHRSRWLTLSLTVMACVVCAVGLSLPISTHAALTQDITAQYDTAGSKAGLSKEKGPQQLIAEAIQVILGMVGTLFLVLIVFAGYVRLTAHGEEDRIKKSTSTAVAALLGLAIVLIAYGVTRFVASRLANATTYEPQYEENNQAPNTTYEKTIDLKLFN